MTDKYNLTEYVDRLYFLSLKKCGDYHMAWELAQDTFAAVLSSINRGAEIKNIWAYLERILSNKYNEYLRQKYNKPWISFNDYPLEIEDETILLWQDTERYNEQLEAIRHELCFLACTHREVMVRFYIHGEGVESIAKSLKIPVGTVKSRLNTGRKHIREGVNEMENYTKQSYEPDTLMISCSGGTGINGEPFSMVSDKLTENILLLAYDEPVTETELARALGTPAAFVEPVVNRLIDGELMKRKGGGKVYTDFIIYTEKERTNNLEKQIKTAEEHFDLFWKELKPALENLRKRDFYRRQKENAKKMLELHFSIDILQRSIINVRDNITDAALPYSEYPYRKNGGRWFAIGNKYSGNSAGAGNVGKYEISGEYGVGTDNVYDLRTLELRGYDTSIGQYPGKYKKADYVKWLYEIFNGTKTSYPADYIIESIPDMMDLGILNKADDKLEFLLPVVEKSEYIEEKKLAGEYKEKISGNIHNIMEALLETGYVYLPKHLTSVPKWLQYMYCANCIPMAVIYRAMEEGLLLNRSDAHLPALILVYEKTHS